MKRVAFLKRLSRVLLDGPEGGEEQREVNRRFRKNLNELDQRGIELDALSKQLDAVCTAYARKHESLEVTEAELKVTLRTVSTVPPRIEEDDGTPLGKEEHYVGPLRKKPSPAAT